MGPVQAPAEQFQYLTFCLGGEEYAIGILRVTEVIKVVSAPALRAVQTARRPGGCDR